MSANHNAQGMSPARNRWRNGRVEPPPGITEKRVERRVGFNERNQRTQKQPDTTLKISGSLRRATVCVERR